MNPQPTLASLTEAMIQLRVTSDDPIHESEVELHDGTSGFRVDLRTAWNDATYAAKFFGGKAPAKLPSEWAGFVNTPAGSPAIPLATGHAPQRLRDLQTLVSKSELAPVGDAAVKPIDVAITDGNFAINEKAAGLWNAGRTLEALELWKQLAPSPVASFNVGMGLLFTGKPADAIPHLRSAAEQLPEETGWNHLAQLYLAVCQMRR